MGRGHGDRDRGWDRHHGDEGRGPVDIDRRADRDRPGRWAKGDRIPRNTASANISSTTGAPTTWPRRRAYHWVGVGGDYFLVAPTGIVFNVMIGG